MEGNAPVSSSQSRLLPDNPCIISVQPCIKVEQTGQTLCQIYFNPAQINPDPALYEQALTDLRLRSAGAIIIEFSQLASGWIVVCQNPARGEYSIDRATGEIADMLKKVYEQGYI